MRLLMAAAMVALSLTPTLGDDVPFAAPPPDGAGSANHKLTSLGDVMGLTQLRHIKLWYAGRQQNWPLVRYELRAIEDTFQQAAMFYRNIPVSYVDAVARRLDAIRKAADGRNTAGFAAGFAALTGACNACHKAANVEFIAIQTPTASPFSNQKF